MDNLSIYILYRSISLYPEYTSCIPLILPANNLRDLGGMWQCRKLAVFTWTLRTVDRRLTNLLPTPKAINIAPAKPCYVYHLYIFFENPGSSLILTKPANICIPELIYPIEHDSIT